MVWFPNSAPKVISAVWGPALASDLRPEIREFCSVDYYWDGYNGLFDLEAAIIGDYPPSAADGEGSGGEGEPAASVAGFSQCRDEARNIVAGVRSGR
jgi:hypothetical protein